MALPTADPNLSENIDADTVSPALLWPDIHSPYSEQSVYMENRSVIIIPKEKIPIAYKKRVSEYCSAEAK